MRSLPCWPWAHILQLLPYSMLLSDLFDLTILFATYLGDLCHSSYILTLLYRAFC